MSVTPILYRVILSASSIVEAEKFYTHLLGIQGERVSPGRHYFQCGGPALALFDPRADGDDFDARPNPNPVYFAVGDLEAVFDRAKTAGCSKLDDQIALRPWGERSFYGADPFGNPICFVDESTLFTGG
jgi:catechol 2,3-dioxygenase-like lactoylglutathione lyase family enzyme